MSGLMASEYQTGTRRALIISLGALGAILVLPFVIELVAGYLLSYDPAMIEHDEVRGLKQEFWKGTLVSGSINFVYAALGAAFILLGAKCISQRRFPPPGIEMPFRIRVQKDRAAIISGISVCILGCTFLSRAVLFVIYWPWKLL